VTSAEEDAQIARDRDLLIKDGWPRGVAEQKALDDARQRARDQAVAEVLERPPPPPARRHHDPQAVAETVDAFLSPRRGRSR
jgi:hypothetical protein